MFFFFFDNKEFEEISFEIVRRYSKEVKEEYRELYGNGSNEFDALIISHRGYKALLDIKVYAEIYTPDDLIKNAARRLALKALDSSVNNLVIITSTITNTLLKEFIYDTYGVRVIDLRNLLHLSKKYSDLNLKLMNLVLRMYEERDEIDAIEFKYSEIFEDKNTKHCLNQMSLFSKPDEGDMLVHELENLPEGRDQFRGYEDVCSNTMSYLFKKELSGWYRQERTEDGLHAFDMICRFSSDKGVWGFLSKSLNSQYLVLEYKNYTDQITQKEIFTTEKYLFQRALRNIAFIISRKGPSKNALKACGGILREQGKLILNLTDEDLKNMIHAKKIGSDPSEYLFEKIDSVFLHLSK